eukprot:augustus_masked-scaffold_15-processed-gene-2.6-mRNA-1 protein AED:0.01 eAED:0.01 QI:0/-1/0/1/-1/1/1/0/342
MRPIILKGHTRPLTCVKYNKEGDLLFTSAKDKFTTVWFAENGERLGTYEHKGSVWSLDVDPTSTFLLTACADMMVRVWLVETGELLHEINLGGVVRDVEFNEGCTAFMAVNTKFVKTPCRVHIFYIDINPDTKEFKILDKKIEHKVFDSEIQVGTWAPRNEYLVFGDASGNIRLMDPGTGEAVRDIRVHNEKIQCLSWNKDKTMLISGGADMKAVLFSVENVKDWAVLKEYASDTPVNAAVISPIKEHVLVAGGQEAMNVTTTDARVGKFETKFFHMVFSEHWGSVKGHFGPVNALAMHPDGIGFTSGSEDGYLRVHKFDKDYFEMHSEFDDLTALEEFAKA